MPYDPNDPRSQLATPVGGPANLASTASSGDAAAAPEFVELSTTEPDEITPLGTRSWIVRSQTGVVVYSDAVTGERLDRLAQLDEYVLVLVSAPMRPAAHVVVTADAPAAHAEVDDDAVVIVPPGRSSVVVTAPGVLVRAFSNEATDLVGRAGNAAAHDASRAHEHRHTAAFAPWPPSPEGDRLRVYRLADIPLEPGRFGTIFRCRTVMVNVIPADLGARDPARLSPHHHDDFEQISLQIDGDYVHHIRTPWTTDLATWRDDVHRRCTSPALVVIPPPTVHTSQGVGDQRHQLIDIFVPPRLDFSLRPGWVVNERDYPVLPSQR